MEDRPVPGSHVPLLTAPVVGVLTTLLPDGQPHSCLVWTDYDGECARVNTTLQRQSGRNLLARPAVSLLVVDPDDTGRYLQIRGEAELVRDGAVGHLDAAGPGDAGRRPGARAPHHRRRHPLTLPDGRAGTGGSFGPDASTAAHPMLVS